MEKIKLTQYSHGAGCGCKISPAVLDTILHSQIKYEADKNLLVGNNTRDDAAVYDLGDGTALISTTDFFMPIVDDPFDFGRIASANAISDVYAMGGKPILAIAILGWPIGKLAPEVAQKVMDGARSICAEAGISLAGGHSIDCPEPVFGLAVNGIVAIKNLKQNSTAVAGCKLYLTKALGVGILTTAQKKGILKAEHANIAPNSMSKLNSIGEVIGKLDYVKAMTDVTGFGLLGHLSEMCEGSNLQAAIDFEKVPKLAVVDEYLEQKAIPGGTNRNWESYGHKIGAITDRQKHILADPQTSGGLLVAVLPEYAEEFENLLKEQGIAAESCVSFGVLNDRVGEELITVT
ncbi:selenide,water dikinase [Pedobacter sp. UYP30]